jgi:hypothetical protein
MNKFLQSLIFAHVETYVILHFNYNFNVINFTRNWKVVWY